MQGHSSTFIPAPSNLYVALSARGRLDVRPVVALRVFTDPEDGRPDLQIVTLDHEGAACEPNPEHVVGVFTDPEPDVPGEIAYEHARRSDPTLGPWTPEASLAVDRLLR